MTPRKNWRHQRRLVLGLAAITVSLLVAAVVVELAVRRGSQRAGSAPGSAEDASPSGYHIAPERPALVVVARPGVGPHRVAGTVTDTGGDPVVGATVTAEIEAGPSAPYPTAIPTPTATATATAPRDGGPAVAVVAVTAEDGQFELIGLDTATYRLRVEGEGIFPAEVRYVDVPGQPLRLVVARKVALRGQVVVDGPRIAGVPVAVPAVGVEVGVAGYGAVGAQTTVTDATGSFEIAELVEGSYRVWATAEEQAAPAVAVDLLGAGPFPLVTLRLEPAAVVIGRVVDVTSGLGVIAAVTLTAERSIEPERHGGSDSDGRFRLPGIPLGRWTASAYAPGYIAVEAQRFAVGGGYSPTLELTPGAVASGVVVDPDGVPVREAVVVLHGSDDHDQPTIISEASRREQAARASGRGGGGLVAGQRFVARGELGVLLGPIPYPPPPGGRVRVATLVDADPTDRGTPPLEAPPGFESRFITDQQGRFRIAGLAPGRYVVAASHRDFADARGKPFTIELGAEVSGLRVVMVPGVILYGSVVDRDGGLVVGATLTAEVAGDQSTRVQAVTGADGNYRLGPIATTVTVDVVANGYGGVRRQVTIDAPGSRLTERREEFVLVRADAVVSGRVVDGSGFPVRGARIELAARERYASTRYGVSDDTGGFTIGGLAQGSYAVRVSHDDFPPVTATASTAEPVRLTLAFGGGIAAVVRDLHTRIPLAGVRVVASGPGQARHEALTGEAGEVELVPLVAGRWSLAVSLDGYVADRVDTEVRPATQPRTITQRDLVLELGRGATLAGVVRDRNGDRVRGATVAVGARETKSDEDGRFRLVDVATGEVDLEARRGDATGKLPLILQPGDEVVTLEIEVR